MELLGIAPMINFHETRIRCRKPQALGQPNQLCCALKKEAFSSHQDSRLTLKEESWTNIIPHQPIPNISSSAPHCGLEIKDSKFSLSDSQTGECETPLFICSYLTQICPAAPHCSVKHNFAPQRDSYLKLFSALSRICSRPC